MKPLAVLAFAAMAVGLSPDCRAAQPAGGADLGELLYIVFLRPDPARLPLALEDRQHIQDAHMANIHALADRGILLAAGPMDDTPTTISGIFVFRAPTLQEAQRIAALDPTVSGKRNTVDVHPWMAPKGIGTSYFGWKRDNPKAEDVMAAHAFCIVKRGTAWGHGTGEEHDRFIMSLHAAGILAAAGPVPEDPALLGVVIFKGPSIADATKALGQDPAVISGAVTMDYHLWWTADRILPW